jgi:hypothetical protein
MRENSLGTFPRKWSRTIRQALTLVVFMENANYLPLQLTHASLTGILTLIDRMEEMSRASGTKCPQLLEEKKTGLSEEAKSLRELMSALVNAERSAIHCFTDDAK